MKISEKLLSINDFAQMGAFELYSPAALLAFTESREVAFDLEGDMPPAHREFRLEDLFAARTKFLRQLWLARQPGILPMALMHQFGLLIALQVRDRLAGEGALSDIRLNAALAAQQKALDGRANLRTVEPLRAAVLQAAVDHDFHATARAAAGCQAIYSALDPDGYEAGAGAAFLYLKLFPGERAGEWLRARLLELIRAD